MKKWVVEKVVFRQEKDCCDGETSDLVDQFMEVEIQDGGCGAFVVIRTQRWALDEESIDEFSECLKEMIKKYDKAEDNRKISTGA